MPTIFESLPRAAKGQARIVTSASPLAEIGAELTKSDFDLFTIWHVFRDSIGNKFYKSNLDCKLLSFEKRIECKADLLSGHEDLQ